MKIIRLQICPCEWGLKLRLMTINETTITVFSSTPSLSLIDVGYYHCLCFYFT